MSPFKSELFQTCKEVAAEFSGWNFTSGFFKNKTLKHTDLVVHPGFGLEYGTTPLQPSVAIHNKRSMALFKAIIGYEMSTSLIDFRLVPHELSHMPENLRGPAWICEDKKAFLATGDSDSTAEDDAVIDIKDARPILKAMLQDGIALIERHYDLSSEEDLLKNLPPRYEVTPHFTVPYSEMEKQKGVMMCIVHVLLGDFDFVEHYRSDGFETVYPKRTADLDKLIAALPALKKRYTETGSVT